MLSTVFQTLTGKEIEIDIEPTDKVKYNNTPWKTNKIHTLLAHCVNSKRVAFVCKWRWSELKRGWRRRKGSPLSSRDSSIVENRCECLHHDLSSEKLSPLLTLSLLSVFLPQEWWEDSRGLQDPGRLGAPSRVGAERRLNAPQALHTPLPHVMSRCCNRGEEGSWVPTLQGVCSVLQHTEIPRSRADVDKHKY